MSPVLRLREFHDERGLVALQGVVYSTTAPLPCTHTP